MKPFKTYQRMKPPLMIGLSCLALLLYLKGCDRQKDGGDVPEGPAEVINQVKENTLTTIRLSDEAEERLGIRTMQAELRNMPGTLTLGGEVITPPGQEAKITAPVSGMVARTEEGYFPVAGSSVRNNQEVMRLIVIPPDMDMISAAEDVRVKQKEYEVAQAELKRAETLLENRAISDRVFESTQAAFLKAEASLKAATGRLDLYQGNSIDEVSANLSVFNFESPVNGIIQHIYVTPGQIVSPSSLLFEVSPFNLFWIRVPVYSGDLKSIDTGQKAYISTMGESSSSGWIEADPIRGPLLSDASSSSSYLYYKIGNPSGELRSGQRVSVKLNLKSTGETIVVPYASIIYDIQGGTWVYVKSEPLVYIRTRVDLDHVADGLAIIYRGLSAGDEVVSTGAAELFGTEFGVGK